MSLEGRRLYLCTPDRPDLGDFVAACTAGGVDVVQLREKDLTDRRLLERAGVAAEACRRAGVPFLVNDRPDLALAAGADGVHVGQDDCPPAIARRILGPEAVIGLSTHSPAQLEAAQDEPVDYISAGPVNPTPTKAGRPGTGLGYLEVAARRSRLPWFATGGVTPSTVADMVGAGARRFVVVRWLTEASDPEGAASVLRQAIDAALRSAGARATPGGSPPPGGRGGGGGRPR
ncbi:MAG TPA: thiamine phosphate synthase [Acidimicrobiales bacterium]|nr:thiamine phosphate synthase [Acidimicrobiales bacterium]